MRDFNSKIKKYLSPALKTKNIFKIKTNFSNNEIEINPNEKFLNETKFSPIVKWYQSEEIYLKPNYIGYTLLLLDFDVPDSDRDYCVHWFIPFIPKDILNIPQMEINPNQQFFKLKKFNIRNGLNSWGKYGYVNPAPPKKSGIHHYYLFIFGVKEVINSDNFEQFLQELDKVNSFGFLIGKYSNDINIITNLKNKKKNPKYIYDNSIKKKSKKKNKINHKKISNKKQGGMYTDSGLKPCNYQKIGYDEQGAHSLDPIYQISKLNALPFIPNQNTC